MKSGRNQAVGSLALPIGAGFLFFLASLPFLPVVLDPSGFTYVVVAEQGLAKVHETSHPLYVPLLRSLDGLLDLLAVPGPRLAAFQLLSLAAGGVLAGLLARIAWLASGNLWASAFAALYFMLQRQVWAFSGQTKPYAVASCLAAAALWAVLERAWGRGPSRSPALGSGGIAGTLAGLACGFDSNNLALIPALLLWAWACRPRLGRGYLPAFTGAAAAVSGASLAFSPFGAHEGLRAMQASPAMVSVLSHAEVAGPVQAFLAWIPERLPGLSTLAALAPLALLRLPASPGILALSLFGAMSAFFVLFLATNDYVFAAFLGLPAFLAALGSARPWAPAALAAAALLCGGESFLGTILPRSKPRAEPARIEGDLLERAVRPGDLLLAASGPDWRIAYLYANRFPMVRLDTGRGWEGAFESPRLRVTEEGLRKAEAALARGARVLLAADALFLPEFLGRDRLDRFQQDLQRTLLRRFRFGPRIVSPNGQWYVALLPQGRTTPLGPSAHSPLGTLTGRR